MKIKSRKQREKEYNSQYGNVSNDVYERLRFFLGDNFNETLLENANKRIKEVHEKVKYNQIKITFYEEPYQSHRPRVNFHTRGLHVPLAKENLNFVKNFIDELKEEIKLVSTPMRVDLIAYFPMPSNLKPVEVLLYETEHDMAIGKPDFDNILKAYVDMIRESIILDDDIVSESYFKKYYSLKPRVILTITYTNGFVSEHSYKKITTRKSFKDLEDYIDTQLIVTPISKQKKKKNKGD
jgi:Holliday junction resolvase RusA-like endonuclease